MDKKERLRMNGERTIRRNLVRILLFSSNIHVVKETYYLHWEIIGFVGGQTISFQQLTRNLSVWLRFRRYMQAKVLTHCANNCSKGGAK